MDIEKSKAVCEINDELKKNRKFIKGNLIVYSDEEFEDEEFKLMKNGYMEMSKINLEISESNNWEQEISKYKFDDINEYEKWLCGV